MKRGVTAVVGVLLLLVFLTGMGPHGIRIAVGHVVLGLLIILTGVVYYCCQRKA
jgi:hypothetical protein